MHDPHPHRPESMTVLAQLAPGQRATVVGMMPQANAAVADRLWQLGFRPTARVDVVRRAPLGDPTIYRVQDTELCIRRREARLIQVLAESDQ
ncbi:FeoA family protein [Mycobacterium celatum]|uniref:Ferrous iron transport protein A n=2 Tax=Mycobacterium celatum TaxID=28045 RepID=A0A1X1RM39_MYCCE|nr:FeoA family protein [Mycobacterium celatum]ORV09362.1 iron transporter FeoA [Mycobacterium celatum]PIB73670.1 ferrous iron transport protein A [Mycobacterium celatum]